MNCTNCGKQIEKNQSTCINCGNPVLKTPGTPQQNQTQNIPTTNTKEGKPKNKIRTIIRIIVLIIFVIALIEAFRDQNALQKNDDGLDSYETGNSELAIEQLSAAAQNATDDESKVQILTNLAYVYYEQGNTEMAQKSYIQARDLSVPDSLKHHMLTAEIAMLDGEFAKAYEHLQKAYQKNPKDFQVNNSLALFLTEDGGEEFYNPPKALEHAKTAYEYDPRKSPISKNNLGIAYFYNNNLDQALKNFLEAAEEGYPGAHYWAAWTYVEKNEEENARASFQKAIESGEQFVDLIYDFVDKKASFEEIKEL